MRFTPLSMVRQRVRSGAALPFNVYNHDQTLLLAKGQVVESQEQLHALFERGTLVDIDELRGPDLAIDEAQPHDLGRLWTESMDRLRLTLSRSTRESLVEDLDEASTHVKALIERDPDLAIMQIMRQEGNAHSQYGLNHAIHTAIVCHLVAQRLRWNPADSKRAFKAALTMNVSMFELQGILAEQTGKPTQDQTALIRSHPTRSRVLLEQAGVTDTDWLVAVEQHHETADGRGYPHAIREPSELASLLTRADVYAAKLSPRRSREALPADRASRDMFMRDPRSPICAALVKEFGVYPPGCYVALASGETGVVIKRGPTVTTPAVMVLFDAQGRSVRAPIRRDTGQAAYAVTCAISTRSIEQPAPAQQICELATL
jgi:HD-GYP domain-containing protein (c-di-GMP phosphodiesterase class II)